MVGKYVVVQVIVIVVRLSLSRLFLPLFLALSFFLCHWLLIMLLMLGLNLLVTISETHNIFSKSLVVVSFRLIQLWALLLLGLKVFFIVLLYISVLFAT